MFTFIPGADVSRLASRMFLLVLLFLSGLAGATALDDYVAQEDGSYGWTIASTSTFSPGGVVYNLDLTSQTWRSPADVNRSVWQHRLNIAVPANRVTDLAMLIVEGGSNTSTPTDISEYAYVSSLVGCTVALLQTVPNQPLRFYNPSTTNLLEDNAIGHTYDRYLNTYVDGETHPDPTWPLLLPMVKSAVKAMDAIQECLAQEQSLNITRFVVGGASKRGWTTWLTGAVDDRVVGIIPVVIDILGMDRQMAHHRNAYSSYPATSTEYYMSGGYSTAVQPYTSRNIFDRLDTPGGESLREIVDPYFYRDRLTMPKLIINSTGDQFFLPDGIKFYYNQLPGEKYVYYVPNTDHGLGFDLDSLDVIYGLLNFVKSFYAGGTPMPDMDWSFERDGSIRVVTQDTPAAVWLWQAHTPTHRDFRLRTMGPIWQQSPLDTHDESGAYVASVPTPDSGWTGFYIQVDFPTGMSLCSGLRVLPDTYANDAEPPDIFGPEFTLTGVTPGLARAGTVVEIAVESSETLLDAPVLSVNGNPASLASQDGTAYVFSYTVGDADQNGSATLSCSGEDQYDNPDSTVFANAFTVDTVAPECLGFVVEPSFARPGDLVSIQFSASEDLARYPNVTVNGRPATLVMNKDTAYSYAYVIDPSQPVGPARIEVVLGDAAGNITRYENTETLEIGGTLPLHGAWPALLLTSLGGVVMLRRRPNPRRQG